MFSELSNSFSPRLWLYLRLHRLFIWSPTTARLWTLPRTSIKHSSERLIPLKIPSSHQEYCAQQTIKLNTSPWQGGESDISMGKRGEHFFKNITRPDQACKMNYYHEEVKKLFMVSKGEKSHVEQSEERQGGLIYVSLKIIVTSEIKINRHALLK